MLSTPRPGLSQCPQPGLEWLKLFSNEARLELIQKRVHQQQRVDFGLAEPETGKVEAARSILVATQAGRKRHRRSQAVPHEIQITFELRGGDFEGGEELAFCRRLFPPQQAIDLVNPLQLAHWVMILNHRSKRSKRGSAPRSVAGCAPGSGPGG